MPLMLAGAGIGAATADGAGVSVEKLTLGEVLDAGCAENLGGFKVGGSRERAARFEGTSEEVDWRADEVHVLRQGYVDCEAEDDGEVSPPEEGLKDACRICANAAEYGRQRSAYRGNCVGTGAAASDVERLSEQREDHEHCYQRENDCGLFLLREVEFEAVRREAPPPDCCPSEHEQEQGGEDIEIDGEGLQACVGENLAGERMPEGVEVDEQDVAE